MNKLLPKEKSAELLHSIQEKGTPFVYEQEKHRVVLLDEAGEETFYFRLPITLSAPVHNLPEENTKINYVVLLIQSGNCALGYFEDGRNLDHKVFRSYMVRKKQGKSQIKYLKTKGKSRAGSRVRLGETVEFFENINERLQQYFKEHVVHRIAISCSKTLIPYLYSSKIATPFDKNDPRLYKIPKHIHTPIYEVLLEANRFLMRGELIYDAARQGMVEELLSLVDLDAVAEEETIQENELEDEYYLDEPDDEMEW
ncbi:hypothetical protein ACFSRY_00235 [Pontibacter locisalis]|uniref:VLRF1 domain-containing protein n=1 Tax=Pontibacter locisalis TaxID=1719035 RepID=A0ABW5IH01_9BACT